MWPVWLADGTQPKALLAPYPAEEMTCWPVSPRVGNVKNNHEPDRAHRWRGFGTADRGPMEAMSWHRWLATLLVMRALAACAKGARLRLHTRHTRWRMCTTGAVTVVCVKFSKLVMVEGAVVHSGR